jgi:eukaryotic translation initiation factor 2C
MENPNQVDQLEGGLCHLRVCAADEDAKYSVPVGTVVRPGFNLTGKEVEVQMNAFAVTNFPSKTVYQYDVSITSS